MFVEDAVAGTAQVGTGAPAGAVAAKEYRATQGGIAANHPLLQPLEETDIFGNPIGAQATSTNAVDVAMPVRPTLIPSDQDGAKPRRAAAFSSSIKCEHVIEKREKKQNPAPAFGSASLDRMMSQIEENAPQPAAPAFKAQHWTA